jgi:hypothetical protein
MQPVAHVRGLAERGALEMRRVTQSPMSRLHAVPRDRIAAVCGFLPAHTWREVEAAPIDAVACQQCLILLRRAGFEVVRGALCARREGGPR